ncbi:MAG: MATE family efflux transporter [Bacteroidaceae bacterium]|nr:MATE family efflux transporter [Bacteroidaceae bacterium]
MLKKARFLELGEKPIGGLLLKYATPAVVAMTASSLYNIIDAIFIGQGVGPLAIAGISLTFPVMMTTTAFGSMIGVGASTLLSVKLGEKDYETARKILGNVVVLNVVMGLVLGLAMLLLLDSILFFFGATEDTVKYACDFMVVILLGNVVTHLYFGLNALLRAASHPKSAMMATIFTVCLNVVFCPLFIYGFGWGIRGAAFATVLSQAIVLIWQFRLFSNRGEFIHFQRGIYRLRRRIVLASFGIGLSPFLINLTGCLVSIFVNKSLLLYGGDFDVASYGICNRFSFFFLMIVMGLNQGMQPIVGYNYGAEKMDRVKSVLLRTIVCATVVMSMGFAVGMLFPRTIISAFTTDKRLIDMSIHYLMILISTFPLIGFQIVVTQFFQSIGVVKKSIFLSLSRQLIFLIPSLIILPLYIGADGVFWSIPVGDVAATFTTAVLFWLEMRKFNLYKTKRLRVE